ncbi:uncharacterized protein NEMAJ01_1865 [Nematocida major]|uniref:uncharacterized protein n=1 Tax=Nematocida major TaxID=1912982 RepID=UPI00200855F5|nr:uncharacterized protein NEMAJ01_1865 [Nematocida major]KAH9386969.1 hypothetical protein NEMAJ01_1865 [Nematocida major]
MRKSEERKDVLICGVNGFTAQKLLEYIVEKRPEMTLGVTCRSEEKLSRVFEEVSVKSRNAKALSRVEKHITGVDSIKALARICEGYSVIINCIGPFAKTGLSVIEATIQARSNYIDCSGEPGFIQDSIDLFQEKAQEAGSIVVHACGFDSLPIDIGIVHTVQEAERNGGIVDSAESYMHLKGARINLGTFKTIICSLESARAGRRKKKLPEKKIAEEEKKKKKKSVRKFPFFSPQVGMYAVLFPGSDSFVVRRTRVLLGSAYPICHCYISFFSALDVLGVLFLALVIGAVYLLPSRLREAAYECVDVLTFGRVRSEGPTQEEIASSEFRTQILAEGKNAEGEEVTYKTVVSGPDPGYVTTPIALLASAETILEGLRTEPRKGGVYTPGAAFVGTQIVQRLVKEGISFCTETRQRKTR